MPASISDLRAREPLLRVAVGEQPERPAALDDRQDLEAPALARGSRRRWRAPPRGSPPRRGRCRCTTSAASSPTSSVNFASITSSKFISRAPVAERHQQTPRRRGARSSPACSRTSRARCARASASSSSCSWCALRSRKKSIRSRRSCLRRHVEVQAAVEPPGPQQRRVERVARGSSPRSAGCCGTPTASAVSCQFARQVAR